MREVMPDASNKLTDKAKKLRRRIEKALIQKGTYKDIKIISKRRSTKKEEK